MSQMSYENTNRETNRKPEFRISGAVLLRGLILLSLMLTLTGAGEAYEHKRNTPSVGGQGMFGYLEGDTDWRDAFSEGLGLNFSIRMNYERNRAYGLSFEQHHFDRITGLGLYEGPLSMHEATDLEFQLLTFDFYQYFNRPQRRTYYVMGSAGFYRPQLLYKFTDGAGVTSTQASFPGEGVCARVGVGIEYFLKRKFSIDARISGYYFHGGDITEYTEDTHNPGELLETTKNGITVVGQASIGVHLYVTQ
jgi:hypothetical protein